jgi:hypothetical protein
MGGMLHDLACRQGLTAHGPIHRPFSVSPDGNLIVSRPNLPAGRAIARRFPSAADEALDRTRQRD